MCISHERPHLHTQLAGSMQSPFQYDNTSRCPYELVLGVSRSLDDVAICVGGHVKNMFFCTRIDIWHVKVQYFKKEGQIFSFKVVKSKILQSETIYDFQCFITYF